MPIAIDTFKVSDAAAFAQFGEWSNRYVLNFPEFESGGDVYALARAIASAEARFHGSHVAFTHAISSVVAPGNPVETGQQFHDFTRAQLRGLATHANPLGPNWCLSVVKDVAQGRAGHWYWRGALDESDTEPVCKGVRKLTRAGAFEQTLSVWWRYDLGTIADAFLVLQAPKTGAYFTGVESVSFGDVPYLGNAGKFNQYRAGGGHDARAVVVNALRDVKLFRRAMIEHLNLDTDFNPVEWKYTAALFLERLARVNGDTGVWAYNPNGVLTPCTKPCYMVSRFGITLQEMLDLAVPVAGVTCDIAVAGLIEGVGYELKKKVKDDQGKLIAIESYVAFDGVEYLHRPRAREIFPILDEYIARVEPLVRADYLNAVNNSAPGYLSGVPSERFTGR